MTYDIQRISEILGINPELLDFKLDGRWLVSNQVESWGTMVRRVNLLVEAGIPAFFWNSKGQWGVLAEKVQLPQLDISATK